MRKMRESLLRDEEVARLHLEKIGVKLTTLSAKQADYLGVPVEGTLNGALKLAMADQKVNNALQTGADYIISTDLSCLMHLDGYIRHKGYSIRAMHIADVLAGS